jgi:hypothetical protein
MPNVRLAAHSARRRLVTIGQRLISPASLRPAAWRAATYPNTMELAMLAPAPGYVRPITVAVVLPVA